MKRTFLPALLLAFWIAACATAPHPPAAPAERTATAEPAADAAQGDLLPVDPDVRIGQLENGLTYYIRRNDEPEQRAELRLAVDAGSVLEEDDQLGLAHFLEHMLFNGTEHFPEHELINFLERTGMRFGPDVNAYTSFDETVYMLTIPTDSTEIVEMAFDVLEDWAAHATLSAEEIDKERGVVVEEWRLRYQNAQGRLQEQTLPVLLHGSRYKDRLPIGDPDVIRNADYETVRRFYRDWYRPDLMAVVAVGDVDVDRMEALIREHFAPLPAPEQPRPRPTFDVPGHEETLYKVATDPEYPYSSVTVYYKKDAEALRTVEDYRERLIGSLFNSLLNDRFAEIARRPDAPFLSAQVFRGGFVRPSEFYGLSARVEEDSVQAGLEAVLTEAARVRLHGFTETELARQKRETLRAYERAYNERENTNSASYAREYVAHFLEDEPIPGIAYEYDLVGQVLPGISLADVNEQAAKLLAERNRVVIATMPEKEGLEAPSEEALAEVFRRVEQKEVAAYVDDVGEAALLEAVPPPATVAAERTVEALGVTEVQLANGVRVVMKPTDFKEDEVRFTAFSPGGSSLVEEEHVFEAEMATALVMQSGVGAFDRTQLQKLLSGRVVNVSPYIHELEEGFSGSASPQDLETLFQLIHLYVTAPRADSAALGMLKNQMRAFLVNRSANPSAVFQDSLQQALYGDHPRRRIPTMEEVENLDLQEAYRIYQSRFADAGDFTFVFVGNFDVAELTALARTYLGSLPAAQRDEAWRDVAPELPEGVVTTTVRKGVAEQSQVLLRFHGPFTYDRESRHRLRSLADVLRILLREELREERGGVYGVSVQASYDKEPSATYSVSVSFSTAPERARELTEAVFEQIEKLKQEGPSQDTVDKVKEQQRRERETALKTNPFWVSVLQFYYRDEDEDLLDVLRYEEMIRALTPPALQTAARTYLERDRYVQGVLYPEHFAGDDESETTGR